MAAVTETLYDFVKVTIHKPQRLELNNNSVPPSLIEIITVFIVLTKTLLMFYVSPEAVRGDTITHDLYYSKGKYSNF